MFGSVNKVRIALTSLAALTLSLSLAACSPSNSDLASQGPETVAERVTDLIRTGDGQGFCEGVNSLAGTAVCDKIFNAKGVADFQTPKPDIWSDQYHYYFYVDGLSLEFTGSRSPEHPDQWIYTNVKSSTPTLSLPYGGELDGSKLVGAEIYKIMPGGFRSEPSVNQDKSGYTKVTLNDGGYGAETTITEEGRKFAKAGALAACEAELKNLKPDYSNLYVYEGYGVVKKNVTPHSKLEVVTGCQVADSRSESLGAHYTYQVKFNGSGHIGPFGYVDGWWILNRDQDLFWSIDASGVTDQNPGSVADVNDQVWGD